MDCGYQAGGVIERVLGSDAGFGESRERRAAKLVSKKPKVHVAIAAMIAPDATAE